MTSLALTTVETGLKLWYNDVNMHQENILLRVEVQNYLLRWYATDVVIVKVDDEIQNFKQVSLPPRISPRNSSVWHLVAVEYKMSGP